MSDYYGPTRNDGKSISGWLVFLIALIVVGIPVGLGINWLSTGADVVSATNVRSISREANEQWNALQGQRASIGRVQASADEYITLYGEDMMTWPQGKRDQYQQVLADVRNKVSAYNTSCADYNALYDDEWSSIVAPKDLPGYCELIQ